MADPGRVGYAALAGLVLSGAGWLLFHQEVAARPSTTPSATGTAQVTRTDVTVREIVGGTLNYLDQAALVATNAGTVTWLPSVGTVVRVDQPLYEVDGRPVMLWTGGRPAWRDFVRGMTDGADVNQLEHNLAELGFGAGLHADGHFSADTAAAICRWQAAHRLPRTGTIKLGEVVFRPGPVRVGATPTALGTPLSTGAPILTVSATTTAVSVSLDPSQQSRVHRGDPVGVSAPGGTHVYSGRVTTVGLPVASSDPSTGGGAPAGAPMATVTVPITIELDRQANLPGPGIGPVQVAITSAEDHGVLAVPIDALLAAPGGGFQVAVRDGESRRLVPVRAKLFDESTGVVEVEGVAEGTTVEVPTS